MHIGPRMGPRIGARIGTRSSGSGGGGLASVTRDATSLIYCPANAAEWAIVMAAAGIASGGPSSAWTMQEPSGNVLDSIGPVALTPSGSPAYQQSVAGWTRKAIKLTDGAAIDGLYNTTTAPNPSLTSSLLLAYVAFPAAPISQRSLLGKAVNSEIDYYVSGGLRMGDTISSVSVASTVQAIVHRVNLTNTTWTAFNLAERIPCVFAAPIGGNTTAFGAFVALSSGAANLYAAEFAGTAAQLSDAQIKTLLQTLGFTILWT